jgi:two-component system chemotaxis response regulator CheY
MLNLPAVGKLSHVPRRVLVADPDADTRSIYRRTVHCAGCEAIEASEGCEALTKALMRPLTLVITEINLPLIDGHAICRILRGDPATRSVPILVVTAETLLTELVRIRESGADGVLVKPTAPDSLLSEMRRLITPADGVRRQSTTTLNAAVCVEESRDIFATCPFCNRPFRYDQSHTGSDSDRNSEPGDYYVCPASCGTLQYRSPTPQVRGTS